ncbi:MAG: PAS domain-containing sensor histidine kinase, partial [Alphaproteobacteria bacterium]|nr:PAS domain-containing sensor histidine kinase [Alphaproteobacteria bacterium]
RVRVETRPSADGGLLILIGDTGIGIERDELNEVKKPFVQGRAADTLRMRGAGLGLSIAEQLMQLHGGALWINSTSGVGTVVTLSLPKSRVVETLAIKRAG